MLATTVTATETTRGELTHLRLRFTAPKGKLSNLVGVMNLPQLRFDQLDVAVTADKGAMSNQEYEEAIQEPFRQLGIDVVEV